MQWSLPRSSDMIVKLHLEAIFAYAIVRSEIWQRQDHETGNAVENCVGTVEFNKTQFDLSKKFFKTLPFKFLLADSHTEK